MRLHRVNRIDGTLARANGGVIASDLAGTAPPPPPPTGTLTMTLVDFYRNPAFPADPVVQRTATTTTGNTNVYYTFTGDPPTQPQGRVTKGGTVVVDWTNLTGVVNHAADGFGLLSNIPQGTGYLLHVRDGTQPGNAPTTSDGTVTWGIGVVVLLVGTVNMDRISSGGSTTSIVPGTSQTEAAYYAAGHVPGALFNNFGWHAPDASTNNGPFSGSVFALMRILSAELATLYGSPVPVGVVSWSAPATATLQDFTGPSGAQYLAMVAANGTVPGGIGLGSPDNYYGGDFEIVLAHHGEANSADAVSVYASRLQTFYQGLLTYTQPFGRGANNLYYGLCLPGTYTTPAGMQNMRSGIQTFIQNQGGTWPHIDITADCLDLPNDGTYFNTAAGELRAMHRMMQGALQFLGCSTEGSSGPRVTSCSLSGLVATLSVVHDGGTALALANPSNPATGFICNTAPDFSGTAVVPTVVLVNSNHQIQLTFPGGTTFPIYIAYMPGLAPDVTNPVYDNASYPTGTTGTDVEALGFPMQPTLSPFTAIAPSASGLSAIVTISGVDTLYDPNGSASTNVIVDQGVYTDAAFTQRSILVTDPAIPELRLLFRHNETGTPTYSAVFFEFGESFTTYANLMAYTAVIYRSGVAVKTQVFPTSENKPHFKFDRWRYEDNGPFPVRATASAVQTAIKIYPRYGTICKEVKSALTGTYQPMSIIGLNPNMGTTGEHQYMGPVNEYSAEWLSHSVNQASWLLYAEEGQGSLPHWYRTPVPPPVGNTDPTSHLILNIITDYPHVQATSPPGGSPTLDTGHSNTTGPWLIGDKQLTEDSGHDFEDCYVAWFATGDPAYIEECQAHANRVILEWPFANRYTQDGRYRAWQVRTITAAANMTTQPAQAPWLRDKNYFEGLIANFKANYLARATSTELSMINYMYDFTGTGPKIQVPGQSIGCFVDPFTQHMETWALAMLFRYGYGDSDWITILNWAYRSIIKYWDGTSGYYRGSGLPYSLSVVHNTTLAGTIGTPAVLASQVPPFNITTGGANVANGNIFCVTGTSFRPGVQYVVGVYGHNGNNLLEQIRVQRAADDSGLVVLARALNGSSAVNWEGRSVIRDFDVITDPAELWWVNNDIGNQPVAGWYTGGTPVGTAPPISNQSAQWLVTPSNTTLFHGTASSVTYPSYARAALAMLDDIGTAAFSSSDAAIIHEAFTWLEGQFRTWCTSSWTPDQKWAHYGNPGQAA